MKKKLIFCAALASLLILVATSCYSQKNNPPSETNPAVTETDEQTQHVHSYGEWQVSVHPTCTDPGQKVKQCTCGDTLTENIPSTGHTAVTDAAVAPTCKEAGLTEGKHCSGCGEVFIPQNSIDIIDHNIDWKTDKEPDWGIEGSRHGSCSMCGENFQETLDALYSEDLYFILQPDNTYYVIITSSIKDDTLYIPPQYKGLPVTGITSHNGVGGINHVNDSIKSVVIPESVTTIEKWAFSYCTALTDITIPSSVTSIGLGAFSHCTNLSNVTIQNGITHIEDITFEHCTSLAKIIIPNSVTSIGSDAFDKCTSLETIDIPNSVTSIESYAFRDCVSLSSITIPDGITQFNFGIFLGCTGLTHVTLPNTLVSIPQYMFENCSALTEITIPNSVTTIEENAFDGCVSLTEITLRENIKMIEDQAFKDCTSLTEIVLPNGVSIDCQAFSGCKNVTSLTIPQNLTITGDAPLSMSNLTDVYVPNIGTWLNVYTKIPGSGVLHIMDTNGEEIHEIVVPDGVTAIGDRAFYEYRPTGEISVILPDGVTSIGERAFSGFQNMTSISLPHSLTTLGEYAFSNCTGLTLLTIPSSITAIGCNAFYGCSNLKDVYINDLEAWMNISFDLPDTQNGYVHAVPQLQGSLHIMDSQGEEVTELIIPSSTTEINTYIFAACHNTTSITISDGITCIGKWAFYNCSQLTSIVIPKSVTEIAFGALANCPALTDIYYAGTEEDWNSVEKQWMFSGTNVSCTTHYNYTPAE